MVNTKQSVFGYLHLILVANCDVTYLVCNDHGNAEFVSEAEEHAKEPREVHLPGAEFSAAAVIGAIERRRAVHDQQRIPEIFVLNLYILIHRVSSCIVKGRIMLVIIMPSCSLVLIGFQRLGSNGVIENNGRHEYYHETPNVKYKARFRISGLA